MIVLLLAHASALAADAAGPPYSGVFPTAQTKKGLQVEWTDDAIALGIDHAAINVNLTALIAPAGDQADATLIRYRNADGEFLFRGDYLRSLESQIRPLSDRGILVYAILLAYASNDPAVDHVFLHPDYDPQAPNHLSALNANTPSGRQWLRAVVECLAERWSRPTAEHGRVVGYIVGNEVNSHWYWHNQGRASLEKVNDDYVDAVRLVHTAVRSQATWPRVYLSLDHHWNIAYPAGENDQGVAGRALIDRFARRVKETPGGDFDWHIAYHPYPENLFEPRFWNDKTATHNADTPRITFKNLQVLCDYLQQPALLCDGNPRRVILSEQGFHTPDGEQGEVIQAAAYCYAYAKIERQAGIDAFILHRHIDHPDEGGLHLGLRRRMPGAADPHPKKKIYDCFRAAGTPRWPAESAFALPMVGLKSWDDL